MPGMDRSSRLVYLALMFAAAAGAQSGGWSTPAALSTGGQGWEAAAAIDGNGNSLAIWDERTTKDQLLSRAEPQGGSWGHALQVSPSPLGLQTTMVFPAVRASAGGFATAVWTDSDGVWTANRPAAGQWNPSELLIPGGANPIFTMNSRGDAVIAWTIGSPPGPTSSVMVMVRPAGGTWTAPTTLGSGRYVTANHVGMSENGTAIVTWESFSAVCNADECAFFNFQLRASRREAGGSGWAHSGVLLGPDPETHNAEVALDAHGRGILVAFSSSGAFVSATQGASGGPWSAFNSIVNPQVISMFSGLESDNAGNATLVYELIGFPTSQAFAVSGTITGNTWSAPVLLSGSDMNVSQIYFAQATNGAGVAAWLSSTPTAEIHVAVKAGSNGTWSNPGTVSIPGSTEIGPEASAVNTAGNAIVIYSGYDASDIHTEYATNFTP